ncbi:MAG: hypothetical protein ABH867_00085 [Patescibacteria group bacterium]|nr:hypothetical protein [Patescibacteria group bacterium]
MKLKRIAIIFSLLLVVFSGAAFFAKKAEASLTFQEWIDDTEMGEGNMEQWQDEGWGNDIFSLTSIFIGKDLTLLQGKEPGKTFANAKGALPSTIKLIGQLYKPPASGTLYLADTLQRIGGKQAYAQGIGFVGLQPILPIWRGFRNVTYAILTIVFVVIGVAIMFRTKVSPQAVITVQNALPKVIGALLLITFSYAIAGFMIDITYLVLALVIRLLMSAGLSLPGGQSFQDLVNFNMIDALQLVLGSIPWITVEALAAVLGAIIFGLLGGLIGNLPGILPGAAAGLVIGPVLIGLIILIYILFNLMKFFFALMKCYVNALLQIVLGPLQIIAGAIPGMQTSMGFGTWLQRLMANLLVFPISALFLIIAKMVIDAGSQGLWAPTLLGQGQTGGIMGGFTALTGGGLLTVSIGLGVITILAKLPDLIVQSVFAIKPSPFGETVGAGLAGFGAGAMAPVRGALGVAQPALTGGALGLVDQRLGRMETSPTGGSRTIMGKSISDVRGGVKKFRDYLAQQKKSTPAP